MPAPKRGPVFPPEQQMDEECEQEAPAADDGTEGALRSPAPPCREDDEEEPSHADWQLLRQLEREVPPPRRRKSQKVTPWRTQEPKPSANPAGGGASAPSGAVYGQESLRTPKRGAASSSAGGWPGLGTPWAGIAVAPRSAATRCAQKREDASGSGDPSPQTRRFAPEERSC